MEEGARARLESTQPPSIRELARRIEVATSARRVSFVFLPTGLD